MVGGSVCEMNRTRRNLTTATRPGWKTSCSLTAFEEAIQSTRMSKKRRSAAGRGGVASWGM
jgi:hypothetical protein